MDIVIIKYNAGNIQSVQFALERLGIHATVSDDKETILSADKIIFPGVGEAGSAMQYLRQRNLDTLITNITQPFLGICLGLQLMCAHSEEGNTNCLGIFNVPVKKFTSDTLKIPQIGWNTIEPVAHPLFEGIPSKSYCYFVHSYYAALSEATIATTNYAVDFSSALSFNNFHGVQFHPEKSADIGQLILKNFLSI